MSSSGAGKTNTTNKDNLGDETPAGEKNNQNDGGGDQNQTTVREESRTESETSRPAASDLPVTPRRPRAGPGAAGERGGKTTPRGGGSGRGGGSDQGGKSRRKSDSGASGSRPRAVVFDGPENPPPCEVCGRVFTSWKALFGHMRSHPERSWRGVKPPPVFTPPGSPEREDEPGNALAVALIEIGENILARDAGGGGGAGAGGANVTEAGETSGAAAVVSSPRAGFDLNDDPMEEESPSPKRLRTFDLNKPAADEDDDDSGEK